MEIYEGDIVKKLVWDEELFNSTADGNCYEYAQILYIEELAGFYIVSRDNKILWELGEDKNNIEVIDNIHDNSKYTITQIY